LIANDFAKLTLDERLEMIKKVAQGINVKNCLHLDIKPTNIFINEENGKWNGELVVADFGIGGNVLIKHGCFNGSNLSLYIIP